MLLSARYYDPVAGRFLTRDPIDYRGGDWGLYGYVGNGVTRRVDATGRAWIDLPASWWQWLAALGLGAVDIVEVIILIHEGRVCLDSGAAIQVNGLNNQNNQAGGGLIGSNNGVTWMPAAPQQSVGRDGKMYWAWFENGEITNPQSGEREQDGVRQVSQWFPEWIYPFGSIPAPPPD